MHTMRGPPPVEDGELPEVLTPAEAIELLRLRVTERTLCEMAARGEIPGGKVGREWRFSRRALLGMLEAGRPTSKASRQRAA